MDNLKSNGADPYDLDRLKQEIMVEIRMEINKLKQDIIDGNLCQFFCVLINLWCLNYNIFISILNILLKTELILYIYW